jgi:hypothetical protein
MVGLVPAGLGHPKAILIIYTGLFCNNGLRFGQEQSE